MIGTCCNEQRICSHDIVVAAWIAVREFATSGNSDDGIIAAGARNDGSCVPLHM